MKIGLSVATFDTKFGPVVYNATLPEDLDLIFRKINSYGYDGVDLFIDSTSEERAHEIRNLLDRNHLEVGMLICIYLIDLGVNLSSKDESQRVKSVDIYRNQFKIAKILGAKTMPIGIIRGRMDPSDDKASYEKRLALSLTELVPEAKKNDIVLCIEPINRYEVNTLMSLIDVVDFIRNHQLQEIKILPDLFHLNIEESNLVNSLNYAGQLIGHMHFSDSNRKAPGWGHLDYVSIIKELNRIGFTGFLAIEAMPFGEADLCAIQGSKYLKALL